MSLFNYDLAVAYRVYPKVSANLPPVYADNKFRLVELCLRSFKASLGGLHVKMWVLLNNCPPEYEALFQELWPAKDLVIVRYPGVSGGETLHEQQRILSEQTDAEIVYLAEDDYYYLPGQFELALNFLRQNPDADFTTPYDSPDLHFTDLHKCINETRVHGGKTWRSSVSTTHSFLAKRAAMIECRPLFDKLFKSFPGRPSPDLAMWMALTKKRVFNAWKLFAWLPAHRYWVASVFLSWFYCWRQIFFGRKYTLWTPNPSIATHMDGKLLAPGIDWAKEYQVGMKLVKG